MILKITLVVVNALYFLLIWVWYKHGLVIGEKKGFREGVEASKIPKHIKLLSKSQFDALPEGTVLFSINQEKVIKGLDTIDCDTRYGYLAYGLQSVPGYADWDFTK